MGMHSAVVVVRDGDGDGSTRLQCFCARGSVPRTRSSAMFDGRVLAAGAVRLDGAGASFTVTALFIFVLLLFASVFCFFFRSLLPRLLAELSCEIICHGDV